MDFVAELEKKVFEYLLNSELNLFCSEQKEFIEKTTNSLNLDLSFMSDIDRGVLSQSLF